MTQTLQPSLYCSKLTYREKLHIKPFDCGNKTWYRDMVDLKGGEMIGFLIYQVLELFLLSF